MIRTSINTHFLRKLFSGTINLWNVPNQYFFKEQTHFNSVYNIEKIKRRLGQLLNSLEKQTYFFTLHNTEQDKFQMGQKVKPKI